MPVSAIPKLGVIVRVNIDKDDIEFSPDPPGGRARMDLLRGAKIFIPFDPLEGFADALRTTEVRVEMEQRSVDGGEPVTLDEIFED